MLTICLAISNNSMCFILKIYNTYVYNMLNVFKDYLEEHNKTRNDIFDAGLCDLAAVPGRGRLLFAFCARNLLF